MAKKEEKLLSLNIDNEIREYDANLFSEAANLKVAQMQFADGTILPILSEVTRLVRLGRAIDAEELKKLEYYLEGKAKQHQPNYYTQLRTIPLNLA